MYEIPAVFRLTLYYFTAVKVNISDAFSAITTDVFSDVFPDTNELFRLYLMSCHIPQKTIRYIWKRKNLYREIISEKARRKLLC